MFKCRVLGFYCVDFEFLEYPSLLILAEVLIGRCELQFETCQIGLAGQILTEKISGLKRPYLDAILRVSR